MMSSVISPSYRSLNEYPQRFDSRMSQKTKIHDCVETQTDEQKNGDAMTTAKLVT